MDSRFFGYVANAERRKEDNHTVSGSKAPCVDFEKPGCGKRDRAAVTEQIVPHRVTSELTRIFSLG